MKAERRHELKENDLIHALHTARDYLDQNGKQVAMGVLVIAAAVGAVGLTVRSRAAAVENGWRRMAELQFGDPETGKASLETLATLAADATDQRFIFDSLTRRGTEALRLAQAVPFPPDGDLNAVAEDAFGQLLSRFGDNPLAFGLGHAGLATVAENKFAIDEKPAHKKDAQTHLQTILDEPSQNGLPYQQVARKRLDELDLVFTAVRFVHPVPEPEPEPAPAEVQSQPADEPVAPDGGAAPDGQAKDVADKTDKPTSPPDAP